jgi:hypothetical protein
LAVAWGFPPKARDGVLGQTQRLRENLEGDHPVERDLPRLEHDAHPAPADLLQDLEIADGLTDQPIGLATHGRIWLVRRLHIRPKKPRTDAFLRPPARSAYQPCL